jgi:hypothetical protein
MQFTFIQCNTIKIPTITVWHAVHRYFEPKRVTAIQFTPSHISKVDIQTTDEER